MASPAGPMRILLAVDGSQPSDLAVVLVKEAPWPDETTIRVVTAQLMEPDITLAGPGFMVNGHSLKADLAEQTLSILHAATRQIERPSLIVEHQVLHGFPVDAILDEARRFGAHLVVVGSRGHGGLEGALLGSVSSGVVDHAVCPVLVARQATLQRVIVAYDGSPASTRALALVAEWRPFKSARVVIASVDPPPRVRVRVGGASPTDRMLEPAGSVGLQPQSAERLAQEAASKLRLAGRSCEIAVRFGQPAAEILAIADELSADLVITGSRGHGALPRLVLGSVAHRILRDATCSVLVVR